MNSKDHFGQCLIQCLCYVCIILPGCLVTLGVLSRDWEKKKLEKKNDFQQKLVRKKKKRSPQKLGVRKKKVPGGQKLGVRKKKLQFLGSAEVSPLGFAEGAREFFVNLLRRRRPAGS